MAQCLLTQRIMMSKESHKIVDTQLQSSETDEQGPQTSANGGGQTPPGDVSNMVKHQVLSYAEKIRLAMKTGENPTTEVLSIREVARRLGYSYEHVRKVYNGEPVVSVEFNAAICKLLGLNADIMWRQARLEKLKDRFGIPEGELLPPDNKKFAAVFEQLPDDKKKELLMVAEGMLLTQQSIQARETIARDHERRSKRSRSHRNHNEGKDELLAVAP